MAPGKTGADIDERRSVLIHASSLNRADVIKKVLLNESLGNNLQSSGSSSPPSSSGGINAAVDRDVLDHVDKKGLTALHYAVKRSSLDAIRVLLRLGVDVTVRGGPDSAFPNLTAYEVALSGGCRGKPEEIKQVFLTEAVQAIAQGHEERLSAFLQAGLDASSEYGGPGASPDGKSDAEKISLAQWAEQLGRSDMLSALKDRAPGQNKEAFASEGNGKEENQETGEVVERGGGKRSEEDAGGGSAEAEGRGMVTDHTGMFVEELREVILGLTAECEQLEAALSPQGMMGIVRRARAARQELTAAEKEVETVKALCERWRVEEDTAIAENARLQAAVVEAQAAVHRHRTGTGNAQPAALPNAGAPRVEPLDKLDRSSEKQVPKLSTCNPEGRSSTVGGSGDAVGGGNGPQCDGAAEVDGKVVVAGGADGRGSAEALLESRKREEVDALSSQLQLIAAHLEDELRMMRSLESGSGAGGVLLQMRRLREQAEASQEEARQTFSVSRYLEARVIVHTENGNELRSQLERLNGYLRKPRDAVACPNAAARNRAAAPPGKEDVDASSASLEYGYRGPELDACLSSDDEGDPPTVSPGGNDVKGARAPVAAATATDAVAAAASPSIDAAEALVPAGVSNTGKGGDGGVRDGGIAAVTASLPSEKTATATAEGPAEAMASGTASASDTEGGVGIAGRARALLNAPGVDAEDGVRGWRRPRGGIVGRSGGRSGEFEQPPPKVTVMQDVMSVLFGWEKFAGGRGSRGGNGGEEAAVKGGNRNGAGIMFA